MKRIEVSSEPEVGPRQLKKLRLRVKPVLQATVAKDRGVWQWLVNAFATPGAVARESYS